MNRCNYNCVQYQNWKYVSCEEILINIQLSNKSQNYTVTPTGEYIEEHSIEIASNFAMQKSKHSKLDLIRNLRKINAKLLNLSI